MYLWPKWTRLASFGPILIVHTLHIAYFVAKTCMHNNNLDCCKKDKEFLKKSSPMAQTTRLALFGPVIVIPSIVVVVMMWWCCSHRCCCCCCGWWSLVKEDSFQQNSTACWQSGLQCCMDLPFLRLRVQFSQVTFFLY